MKKNKSTLTLSLIAIILMASACMVFSQSPELEVERVVQTAIIVTKPPSTQSGLETYSSEIFSFNYPNGYAITLPTQSFPALTIEKARNERVEIFQMKDFGNRPWGFSGSETQEDIDGYLPKETLTVGIGEKQYDVWLFYSESDSQIKEELKVIFDSIVIK
jgi:hypothetical protein